MATNWGTNGYESSRPISTLQTLAKMGYRRSNMNAEPKEFVDHELRLIEATFEQSKQILPMVVLVKEDQRFIIPVQYENDAHKDILSQGIKDLVKKSEPDVVIYMAEAWSIDYKHLRNSVLNKLPLPRPSLHPNREEIVIVQIEFKTGEKYGCQAKILRNQQEPRLDKFTTIKADMSMGRFMDFFPISKMN
jgi:hypothetical protein